MPLSVKDGQDEIRAINSVQVFHVLKLSSVAFQGGNTIAEKAGTEVEVRF